MYLLVLWIRVWGGFCLGCIAQAEPPASSKSPCRLGGYARRVSYAWEYREIEWLRWRGSMDHAWISMEYARMSREEAWQSMDDDSWTSEDYLWIAMDDWCISMQNPWIFIDDPWMSLEYPWISFGGKSRKHITENCRLIVGSIHGNVHDL